MTKRGTHALRARILATATAVAAALVLALPSRTHAAGNGKLAFWDTPRKGANSQNRVVQPKYWHAARAAGIQYIRLIPDGWRGSRRDFLIGDADTFRTLAPQDLQRLRTVLKDAHAARLPVVLSMFGLPGARWKQKNGDQDDFRLWTKPNFRAQAFEFWRQLAQELKNDSAIVAYNPLNEPHPERAFGIRGVEDSAFSEWRQRARGTPADLDEFNRGIVAAIRESDPDTPIILDGWDYSSPGGLTHLEPVDDAAVLYAFHNLGPWEYTTFRVNQKRFTYPDSMPEGFTRTTHEQQLNGIEAWANAHKIPASRIVAEEVLVDRRVRGAQRYLEDVLGELNRRRWHWAFYAFRADWDGLDYELGTAPLGAGYWEAVNQGKDAEPLKKRRPNPLWNVIARALAAE